MRILTIFSGVALVIAGIWTFIHIGAPFISFAFVVGAVMLISGLIYLVTYIIHNKSSELLIWHLAEGLIGTTVSGLVLSGYLILDISILSVFAMWIIFSGVNRIVSSLLMYRHKVKHWQWNLAFGVISLIAGICCFIEPIVSGLHMVLVIGCVLILQGMNTLIFGINMKSQLLGIEKPSLVSVIHDSRYYNSYKESDTDFQG